MSGERLGGQRRARAWSRLIEVTGRLSAANSFRLLAAWLVALGLLTGAVFPPFVSAVGVATPAQVGVPQFRAACLAAGLLLSGANYGLVKLVIGRRVRRLARRMREVAEIVRSATTTGDWSDLSVNRCQVPVDGDDALSQPAAAFNSLIIALDYSVAQRHRLEDGLRHQAFHDSLTGLANRAMLHDLLARELSRASRTGSSVFLLYLDLDDFKAVNDSLGHAAGDQLLRVVAERLAGCLRPGDVAARMGGDEFAALLTDVACSNDAERVAVRITAELKRAVALQGTTVVVQASIGIAHSAPGELRAGDLLRHADVAMYEAKKAGTGRYQLFTPHMANPKHSRLQLEAELRQALLHDQLDLYYQPIVDLHDGQVREVEALLRWHHPTRGLLGPEDFIPVAESSQLIVEIGQWVLSQACRQLTAWQPALAGLPPLRMCVNLSPRQLDLPDLPDQVSEVLTRCNLAPERLTLEITETCMIQNKEAVKGKLATLRELGVRVALDDFGTGFAALDELRLPLDTLKIDCSFVHGLGVRPQDTAIVQAILTFASMLHLNVVAEGLETAEQLASLQALGCQLGQGFYFARPLPHEAVTSYLTQAAQAARSVRDPATHSHAVARSYPQPRTSPDSPRPAAPADSPSTAAPAGGDRT